MYESAIMIAKIMAPFLIILGIWTLACKDFLLKLQTSEDKARGILYCRGIMNLLVGLIVVNFYNVWAWEVTLSVTLFGWYALLRGIYILFMPNTYLSQKKPSIVTKINHFLPLVWGIVLLWTIFQG